MVRLNLLLLAVLVACALSLVTSRHHARRHRPRALLELQLAVFDVVGAGECLLAFELDKELSRLVPRCD